MYRISLAPRTLEPISNMDLVSVAAATGYDGVGVRLMLSAPLGSLAQDIPEVPVAELKRKLDDSGLALTAGSSLWLVPNTKVSDYEPLFDMAAELKAENIQMTVRDPEERRALDNFSRSCEMAAKRGLRIAIEFMAYTPMKSLPHVVKFINASGQKNGGICMDMLHLHRSGGTAADLRAVDPKLIYFVQLCDAPAEIPPLDQLRVEATVNRLDPGQGGIPLYDMLDALPADVVLDLEVPRESELTTPHEIRARNLMKTTRDFLAAYRRK